MMRPVTRAFSANDRERNDSTNERNNSNDACESDAKRLGVFAMVATEVTRDTLAGDISIQVVQIGT